MARTLWPAAVGALAVFYAYVGDGAWTRRSAIAWMMGSWGARLAVQGMYTRAMIAASRGVSEVVPAKGARVRDSLVLLAAAVACSAPAFLAARNRAPQLSTTELAACGIWLVGFAGETTADRQRLRFVADPANSGLTCRTGVWRYSAHADRVFTALVWLAFALFALSSALRP